MPAAEPAGILAALSELRADLAEQAVVLDCQRRPDAADVALTLAARLAEISDRFAPAGETGGNTTARARGR